MRHLACHTDRTGSREKGNAKQIEVHDLFVLDLARAVLQYIVSSEKILPMTLQHLRKTHSPRHGVLWAQAVTGKLFFGMGGVRAWAVWRADWSAVR